MARNVRTRMDMYITIVFGDVKTSILKRSLFAPLDVFECLRVCNGPELGDLHKHKQLDQQRKQARATRYEPAQDHWMI